MIVRQMSDRGTSKRELVRAHTAPGRAPLVPEIVLRLAASDTDLWHATQDWLDARDVPPPFWAFAWPGGQALARHVLDHPEVVRGSRVFDLGAGSGLVAIACALAGAREVVACDSDAFARAASVENAEANDVRVRITDDMHALSFDESSVVVAADVFYDKRTADAFAQVLHEARSSGARVWVADPRRPYFPRDSFTRVATHDVRVPAGLENAEVMPTDVYEMR
jgi:predicted nicotinamide N-methyase